MSLSKIALAVSVALVLCTAIQSRAEASACLKDSREVGFPDGSVRVRSYLCRSEEAASGSLIRVEFHRLSETAAGSIIKGPSLPQVSQILGQPRLLRDGVYSSINSLFDTFGTKHLDFGCLSFNVDVPKGEPNYQSRAQCSTAIWTFARGVYGASEAMGFPLPKEMRHIQKQLDWPPSFNFFYTDANCSGDISTNPYLCTTLWRSMTTADTNNFRRNLVDYNRMVGGTSETVNYEEKYIRLIRHVTRKAWPKDFMPIVWMGPGCGDAQFVYYPRNVLFDVALIENVSSKPVSLDRLNGGRKDSEDLRAQGETAKLKSLNQQLASGLGVLNPGERLLVPLRVILAVPNQLREHFQDLAGARKAHRRIQGLPAGYVFNAQREPRAPRKNRDGFQAPSQPDLRNFVYGPENYLASLVVDGHEFFLTEFSSNFVQLTAGSEEGSCPFLYAWDSYENRWRNYGKVIHEAQGKAKEATQEIALARFTTKFRLAEEELELAHIDRVQLKVELLDNRVIFLTPENPVLVHADGIYAKLYAGQSLAFSFKKPSWLQDNDVASSALIITGFYEPYSSLRLSRH